MDVVGANSNKMPTKMSPIIAITVCQAAVNPFRAPPLPLPILNPSNFVPKNGFPVVKGLIRYIIRVSSRAKALRRTMITRTHDTHKNLYIRAIGVSHTACKDEFRRNLRSHSWSVFVFFFIFPHTDCKGVLPTAPYCKGIGRGDTRVSPAGLAIKQVLGEYSLP